MDAKSQIEILQQLVASQRANIEALEEKNARLQRQFERARDAARSVTDDKSDPAPRKKRPAPDSGEKQKKPRHCKVCGDEILGFGCLKIDCKAEQARRKAQKAAQQK